MGIGNLGRATTAARSAARTTRQAQDVQRARENAEAIRAQIAELQADFDAEAAGLEAAADPLAEKLETATIKPRRTDLSVTLTALVWAPTYEASGGASDPAW